MGAAGDSWIATRKAATRARGFDLLPLVFTGTAQAQPWEVEQALMRFETAEGFAAPRELLVAAGRR